MTKKIKMCPNCKGEHTSRGLYCNRVVKKNCSVCSKEYEVKCSYNMRKTCSKKCSTNQKKNKCVHCGEPANGKYCKREIKRECLTCGKEFTTVCSGIELVRFCSNSCAQKNPEVAQRRTKTQIERYGALGFNTDKQKETMIKKYGHAVPAKNEKVKQKIRETQYKNNNGKYAFNTQKQKETMVEKYGSYGRLGDVDEQRKQEALMLERYGVRTPSEHPEFLKKAMRTLIKNNGSIFNNSVISKVNLEWKEIIENVFKVSVQTEKLIDGHFFDLFIEEAGLLIDIHPTITHNSTKAFACVKSKCESDCKIHAPISQNYHQNRAKLAMKHEYNLIQIYDWDDRDKVLSLIHGKLRTDKTKYSAHKLKGEKISQKIANSFLNKYHFQGSAKKQEYCYGLFNGDDLIAVATFGKSRYKAKQEWEFIRYAVKSDVIVYGGASKLFSMFTNEVQPKSIVSYVDFNHSTLRNSFLKTLGFNEVEVTSPGLIYHRINDNKSIRINSLLAIGADRLLGTSYGTKEESGMDNHDIMTAEGFLQVYTAGNRVFIWGE